MFKPKKTTNSKKFLKLKQFKIKLSKRKYFDYIVFRFNFKIYIQTKTKMGAACTGKGSVDVPNKAENQTITKQPQKDGPKI